MTQTSEAIHQCQACDTLWTEEQITPLEEVKDLFLRIDPGEVVPSGECPDPDCGALTHLTGRDGEDHEGGKAMITEAMRLRYRVYDSMGNVVGRVGDAYDAAVLAMRGDRLVSYVFAEGDDAGQFVWYGDLQSDRWLRGPDGDEPTLLDIVRQITGRISEIRDAEDEQRRDEEEYGVEE